MFEKQKSLLVAASLCAMALVVPVSQTFAKASVTTSKGAQIQVVDDRGRGGNHPEPGDDRGRGRRGKSGKGAQIQVVDDRGRGGNHPEPGDDRGR